MIDGPFHSASGAVESMAGNLAAVDVRLLALALLFQFLTFAARSTAWRNVLSASYPDEKVRVVDIASANAAGMVCNGVGIAHAGNAVKVLLARSRIRNSHVPAIAGTLGVTAVFDLVAGGVLLALAWRMGAIPDAPLPAPSPLVLGGAAALALIVAVACWFLRRHLTRIVGGLKRSLLEAFAVMRSPARYVREVAALQALAWTFRLLLLYTMLHAFHIPASFTDALLVLVVGGIVGALPTGPGGAGTAQVAVVFALHGTATASEAVTFSLGMQVAITLFNIGLGCIAAMVLFGTVRPGRLWRQARTVLAAARVPTPPVVAPTPAPATADAGP